MEAIFLTALRMVGKLVSIPPAHLSVTYGISTDVARLAITSLACFLVATNRILRPERASSFIASAASSIFTTLLCRSMMWIPFFWSKIYGAILGFHLRARCPKCAPASSNSWKFVLGIFSLFLCFSSGTFASVPKALFVNPEVTHIRGLRNFPRSRQSSGSLPGLSPGERSEDFSNRTVQM